MEDATTGQAGRPSEPQAVAMTSHLLFDFFGTVVDYSSSRTDQGYERSHAIVRDAGSSLAYDDFLVLWSEVAAEHDRAAARTQLEFSMGALGHAFFERAVGGAPDSVVREFVATYLSEWNRGVRYLERRLADPIREEAPVPVETPTS